eukprot:358024-Chlamydomonas_euryale.AAC.2
MHASLMRGHTARLKNSTRAADASAGVAARKRSNSCCTCGLANGGWQTAVGKRRLANGGWQRAIHHHGGRPVSRVRAACGWPRPCCLKRGVIEVRGLAWACNFSPSSGTGMGTRLEWLRSQHGSGYTWLRSHRVQVTPWLRSHRVQVTPWLRSHLVQVTPWLRSQRGSGHTLAQVTTWLRSHPGSGHTVFRSHPGSGHTVTQVTPWLKTHTAQLQAGQSAAGYLHPAFPPRPVQT